MANLRLLTGVHKCVFLAISVKYDRWHGGVGGNFLGSRENSADRLVPGESFFR